MAFQSPQNFWWLLGLPILALFYVAVFKWKQRTMARFASPELMEKLSSATSRGRQVIKALLLLGAYFFMVLTLARPMWGTKLEMMKRKGVDIIIALDVSQSMLAEDIKPNRLERAKHEIGRFIEKLGGDRVGLVAFAGDAFLQCPLTLDYGAARIFLDILEPGIIPTPGTALGPAIRKSLGAFELTDRKYKVVLLITDGEDHGSDPLKAAEEADKEGAIIYTLGIGNRGGVPIPLHRPGGSVAYKKDRRGNVVMTKLDEITLQKISLLTDGQYFHSTPRGLELSRIQETIAKMEKKELESRKVVQFEERFQWPLSAALLLIILECFLGDRRKKKQIWKGRFV